MMIYTTHDMKNTTLLHTVAHYSLTMSLETVYLFTKSYKCCHCKQVLNQALSTCLLALKIYGSNVSIRLTISI